MNFFAKIFGGVVEKLYFCTDPKTYQPDRYGMSAPREDLAQGHTADGRRPTSKGVFFIHSTSSMRQPRYSNQEGGCLWVRGAGAEPRSRHPNPKFLWYGFRSRAFFLKKSVFKSV